MTDRTRKWSAFARDVDAALDEASVTLEYRLVAHAHALLRAPGEARPEGEPDVPFDPQGAMRIIGFIDRRRSGRTARGPRGGPPERSFEDAVASILEKIEAIERHEAMMKARGDGGGGQLASLRGAKATKQSTGTEAGLPRCARNDGEGTRYGKRK